MPSKDSGVWSASGMTMELSLDLVSRSRLHDFDALASHIAESGP